MIKLAKDKSQDIQERRSGTERRLYEFALHIPERRRGKDRRKEDKDQKPEALKEDNTLGKVDKEKTKNKKD